LPRHAGTTFPRRSCRTRRPGRGTPGRRPPGAMLAVRASAEGFARTPGTVRGSPPNRDNSAGMARSWRASEDPAASALGFDPDALALDLAARFARAMRGPGRAGAAVAAESVRARIEGPLPEHGMPRDRLLDELEDRVWGGLTGTTGPRYFGYVTGGLLPGAAAAKAWSVAVDQNLGLWALSPAGAELEQVALGWLAELLGYPWATGVFTSGATMANTVAL